MIAYFDTSAFVPLLIEEPTSEDYAKLWDGANGVVSTRLLFVETTAALKRACQLGRTSAAETERAADRLEHLWRKLEIIKLDESLMVDAAALARQFGLRGYDAVHCAAACRINDEGVIGATGDKRLKEAWSNLGLVTFNPGA